MTQTGAHRPKWSGGGPAEQSRQSERALRRAITGGDGATTAGQDAPGLEDAWDRLTMFNVDAPRLERNLVITAGRHDPAFAAFDVLRTRLIHALAENGWNRVGITSPSSGCGKSFTAINLAVSLSRLNRFRTILLDMDLRQPGLARYLGVDRPPSTGDFLRGDLPSDRFLFRIANKMLNIGGNLAIGLNGRVEPYAAELLQQPTTAEVLEDMEDIYLPDVILYDLPPALSQDDVIAMRPHLDCLLMVVGGGTTKPSEVREATRRIGEDIPLVGVILNKGEPDETYTY